MHMNILYIRITVSGLYNIIGSYINFVYIEKPYAR